MNDGAKPRKRRDGNRTERDYLLKAIRREKKVDEREGTKVEKLANTQGGREEKAR